MTSDITSKRLPSKEQPWKKYYSKEALDVDVPSGTMLDYIRANCGKYLDSYALNYFNVKKTYRELLDEFEATAKSFAAIGVKKGDTVALLLPNTPENLYCLYGLNGIGAIADMIDLRSKGEQLKHYINESGASVAVVSTLFADNLIEILDETSINDVIVASPVEMLMYGKEASNRKQ